MKMHNESEHSEEYKKGYHTGYETARRKFMYKKPDMSRLINICAVPPVIEWLHIDGDDESVFCSNCKTSFEWYEPFKFCPECGGRSNLADIRGEE